MMLKVGVYINRMFPNGPFVCYSHIKVATNIRYVPMTPILSESLLRTAKIGELRGKEIKYFTYEKNFLRLIMYHNLLVDRRVNIE